MMMMMMFHEIMKFLPSQTNQELIVSRYFISYFTENIKRKPLKAYYSNVQL